MKKFAALLLVVAMLTSCFAFVACDNNGDAQLTGVAIKKGTLPETVQQNTVVDYSAVKLVLTFDDGSNKEIALTAAGVAYDAIDVTVEGEKTFSVTYGGFTATQTVVVEKVDTTCISQFALPEGYQQFVVASGTKTEKETEYTVKDKLYKVGSVNGFVCRPQTTTIDLVSNKEETLLNVDTMFQLYVKGSDKQLEGADLDKYVDRVEDNVYYFTSDAVGKQFTLKIILDDSYLSLLDEASKTLTMDIEVVDGYNAYDALGLSVLDNLGNNSWAKIKETKLAWDEHALCEYTNVKQVILHNDVTITKANLPESYFWKKTDDGYNEALGRTASTQKSLLEGSLKEYNRGDDWEDGGNNLQRGLFVSNGIGLVGNYLTVKYETGLIVDKNSITAPNGGIFIVCDYTRNADTKYGESHTALIKYAKFDADNSNGTHVVSDVTLIGQSGKTDNVNAPTDIMMFQTDAANATLDNIVANSWFANVELNWSASLDINNCKFYRSFSQMVFGYYANTINVTNCEMKHSGGPLFILQARTEGDTDEDRINTNTVLNIDSTANMESWLSGAEAWFAINKLPSTIIEQLFSLAMIVDNTAGSSFYKIDGNYRKCNAIAVLIPTASETFTNTSALYGEINVGEGDAKTSYSMKDPTFVAIKSSSPQAKLAPVFKSGCLDTTETAGQNLNYGYITSMPDATTIMTTKLENPTLQTVVQMLMGMGLTQEVAMQQASAMWQQSWSKAHTSEFGLYLNPGALTRDTSTEHFLLLFGENATKTIIVE